jgi:hypothetical protein
MTGNTRLAFAVRAALTLRDGSGHRRGGQQNPPGTLTGDGRE